MKKLLILVVILGMASLADGRVLQISVNGDLDPVDREIILEIGETATLNIHNTESFGPGDDCLFALVVDTTYGSITGGVVTAAAPSDTGIYGDDAQANGMCSAPEDGIWGLFHLLFPYRDPGVYVDDVLFECLAEGDAVINLYSTPNLQDFMLEDSVVIEQIPEPVTVFLLAVGVIGIRVNG